MKKLTDEVYFPDGKIVQMNRQDFEELKKLALKNPRGRVMLCAHQNEEDDVHELLIVMSKETYNRPHRHINKGESLHIIEGDAELYLFDEQGNVKEMVSVGDAKTGKTFYYRILGDEYHALRIISDTIIVHETTRGPFEQDSSIYALWAPDAKDRAEGLKFMEQLSICQSKEI